jgi:MFS family permease
VFDMFQNANYPALRHRNFRLLWTGQSVSLIGTMMQNAAVLWHVSLLADPGEKALALGFVGLARVIPILALALVGGVVADAFDRRKLMIVTQAAMAIFATALAVLAFRGVTTLWPIYLLTGLTAAASSFDAPARSSLVAALVPREHLSNAISLNTTLYQLASVIGPSVAGVSLVWLSVGWVYAINAASFATILVALFAMRDLAVRPKAERSKVSWAAAVEGVRFVFGTPLIRASMLLDFNACFFSSATALLPIFAVDVLEVGPAGFGWLYAAPSIGAVAASWWMVRHENRIDRRGAVLLWAVAAYGASTVVFGLSTNFALTLACLAAVGASDTVNMVLRNVIRQLHTPDSIRGRMTAVNVIFAQGGPQLGEVEAGLVAQYFGPAFSVASGGIACIAITGWIALKTPVLRGYLREGALVAPARAKPAPARASAA